MSSLVQAKCVSSATGVSPRSASLRAHQVLDGLDVVAGGRLGRGELVDLGLAEVGGPLPQSAGGLGVQRFGAEHAVPGEEDQPLDLDVQARPVEPRLGQVLAETLHDGAVPPVERAEGLRGQAHETPCRIPGSSWRKSATLARSMVESTVSKRAASE